MKSGISYISDANGKPLAVQLSLNEWEKILNKLKSFEKLVKVKSDLEEAFRQVEQMRKGKIKKQTLSDFLDEI
jgi:hypothetical protein